MLPVSKFSHLPGGYYFTIDSYGEDEFFFFFFFSDHIKSFPRKPLFTYRLALLSTVAI